MRTAWRPLLVRQAVFFLSCSGELVTASAATAVAASAAATTTTAAAATVFTWAGFIDGQLPATDFLAVEAIDRGLGFLRAGHFDKAETLAASRVAVHDDLDRLHLAELLEEA